MIITTTRVTQMHNIVETLQDGPESVEEFLWSEGPWLGEELEKAWENYYEVQGYAPFAACGNDQCRSKDLCVPTSAALPSISPSSPLAKFARPFHPFYSRLLGARRGITMLTAAPGARWRLPKKQCKQDTGQSASSNC